MNLTVVLGVSVRIVALASQPAAFAYVAAVSEQAWNPTASVVDAVVSVPSQINNVTSVYSADLPK
jgi:hypothetical protein